jgi:hypothetical protein
LRLQLEFDAPLHLFRNWSNARRRQPVCGRPWTPNGPGG